jgi:hypothetical protein
MDNCKYILTLSFFCTNASWASGSSELFNDKSGSSIKIYKKDSATKELISEIENTTYSQETVEINGELKIAAVLRKKHIFSTVENTEGSQSKVLLSIYFDPKNSKKPDFNLERDVDDMKLIETRYIETVKYGCCASPDVRELISIGTGATLLKFSDNLVPV